SVCASSEEHDANRSHEQKDIDPWRPVAHIVSIQLNAFVIRRVVPARDLPQAGDARLHHRVETEILTVLFNLLLDDWARSDKAHVAADDIPKLGQFIEAR